MLTSSDLFQNRKKKGLRVYLWVCVVTDIITVSVVTVVTDITIVSVVTVVTDITTVSVVTVVTSL
jgi:hypothetical protein